jgi:hypothetical protein
MIILNYKTISRVEFPVFVLPSDNWEKLDGLFFVDGELIDDKNMPGKTLGIRRLQTPYREIGLLRHTAKNFLAVIKSKAKYFIDNLGRPFIYEKTKMVKVKYHRIKQVDKKIKASVLHLEGMRTPFTVPRPPKEGKIWVGVIYLDVIPWMLYEYSAEKKADTRRKI